MSDATSQKQDQILENQEASCGPWARRPPRLDVPPGGSLRRTEIPGRGPGGRPSVTRA
jgi:hypothetical protein